MEPKELGIGMLERSRQQSIEMTKELHDFAEHTLAELCILEKRYFGVTPSIAYFCRMDISVIYAGDHVNFFVNEITRSTGTYLWLKQQPIKLTKFATDFGDLLHRWIAEQKGYMGAVA